MLDGRTKALLGSQLRAGQLLTATVEIFTALLDIWSCASHEERPPVGGPAGANRYDVGRKQRLRAALHLGAARRGEICRAALQRYRWPRFVLRALGPFCSYPLVVAAEDDVRRSRVSSVTSSQALLREKRP